MACAWHVHGLCMACAWPVHGMCMACAWLVHGTCMACARCMCMCMYGMCKCIANAWLLHVDVDVHVDVHVHVHVACGMCMCMYTVYVGALRLLRAAVPPRRAPLALPVDPRPLALLALSGDHRRYRLLGEWRHRAKRHDAIWPDRVGECRCTVYGTTYGFPTLLGRVGVRLGSFQTNPEPGPGPEPEPEPSTGAAALLRLHALLHRRRRYGLQRVRAPHDAGVDHLLLRRRLLSAGSRGTDHAASPRVQRCTDLVPLGEAGVCMRMCVCIMLHHVHGHVHVNAHPVHVHAHAPFS